MAEVSAGDGWAEAAKAIRRRMDELGLKQFDLATRSGVSIATIREMVHARARLRNPRTLSAVSKGLGWPPGRLASIVRGQHDATEVSTGAGPDTGAELKSIREELDRISRRLDALESE